MLMALASQSSDEKTGASTNEVLWTNDMNSVMINKYQICNMATAEVAEGKQVTPMGPDAAYSSSQGPFPGCRGV